MEDEKSKYSTDFAATSAVLLSKYTTVLKDYQGSELDEILVKISVLITKLRYILVKNAYAVEYYEFL